MPLQSFLFENPSTCVAFSAHLMSIRRNLLKKEIEYEEEAENQDDLPRLDTALPLPAALKGTWAYGWGFTWFPSNC